MSTVQDRVGGQSGPRDTTATTRREKKLTRKDYVSRTTLAKRYGLTPKLIEAMGAPDKEASNPHYRSGPPMQLFLIERVERFVDEHAEELRACAERRPARVAAAVKAISTKRSSLVAHAETVPLEWRRPLPSSFGRLRGEAWSHATSHYGEEAHEPGRSGIFSTVRHDYTNYHDILATFHGRCGAEDAYQTLRNRLDDEIKRAMRLAYPAEWGEDCDLDRGAAVLGDVIPPP